MKVTSRIVAFVRESLPKNQMMLPLLGVRSARFSQACKKAYPIGVFKRFAGTLCIEGAKDALERCSYPIASRRRRRQCLRGRRARFMDQQGRLSQRGG